MSDHSVQVSQYLPCLSSFKSPCRNAMGNAIYTFRQFRESFTGVQLRGMQQNLSWDKAAEEYEQVLVDAKYQW